ncbi:MAG: class I SAM-dependent methyltransferase [Candidatus Aenigmarchaeota archaeon]|nr:class I SAM-dependent methyltransferase [Candidatus Aenigmarchaeota archaeon]
MEIRGIIEDSPIYQALKNPNGWEHLDRIYQNQGLQPKVISRIPLGKGVMNRYHTTIALLNQECLLPKNSREYHVLSIASGPARDMMEVMIRNPNVRADCIDLDPKAIEYGKKLAEEYGVSSRINFIQGDAFAKLKESETYDAIVIMGLIEYMDDKSTGRLLSDAKDHLCSGGLLLSSNLNPSILGRAAQRMRQLGHAVNSTKRCDLTARTQEELRKLGENAGYRPLVWSDTTGQFNILEARKL